MTTAAIHSFVTVVVCKKKRKKKINQQSDTSLRVTVKGRCSNIALGEGQWDEGEGGWALFMGVS